MLPKAGAFEAEPNRRPSHFMGEVMRRRKDPSAWFQQVLTVSEDPAASDWLKAALVQSINRDPNDAARDAEILCRILQLRSAAVLQSPKTAIPSGK
jgi:hypothetical protein